MKITPEFVFRNKTHLRATHEIKKYTITFEANGGSGSQNKIVDVVHGSSFKLPKCTFEAKSEDWRFVGWSTDQNAQTGTKPGESVSKVTDNMTFYAIWEELTKISPDDYVRVDSAKPNVYITHELIKSSVTLPEPPPGLVPDGKALEARAGSTYTIYGYIDAIGENSSKYYLLVDVTPDESEFNDNNDMRNAKVLPCSVFSPKEGYVANFYATGIVSPLDLTRSKSGRGIRVQIVRAKDDVVMRTCVQRQFWETKSPELTGDSDER